MYFPSPPFKLKEFSFLKSKKRHIEKFATLVMDGEVKESEINKIFDEIYVNKYYTEAQAIEIIQKISIASYRVSYKRTDYQVPSGEALIYLSKFIKIEGSINLKILYALFDYLIYAEKRKNGRNCFNFRNIDNEYLYTNFLKRLHHLNKKDKQLRVAKNIERIFNKLKNGSQNSQALRSPNLENIKLESIFPIQ